MDILFSDLIIKIILPITVIVFSAILHEIAHGYVADRLGDPTARLMGRLTLNPVPHIDLYMTIILPLLLAISNTGIIIGGAKPVPVDTFNLRDGRKDMALVSLAGPVTNILIAILAAIFIKIFFQNSLIVQEANLLGFIHLFLIIVLGININLAIFNLLPIPPLDGSKVFSLLLPEKQANIYLSIGNFGILLLFGVLLLGGSILFPFMDAVSDTFLRLLGF